MKYSADYVAGVVVAFFAIGIITGMIGATNIEARNLWHQAQEEIRICEQTLPRDQICVVQLSAQALPRGEE
jgi:hypothetical protein